MSILRYNFLIELNPEITTFKTTDETAIPDPNKEVLQDRCENICDDLEILPCFSDANIVDNLSRNN